MRHRHLSESGCPKSSWLQTRGRAAFRQVATSFPAGAGPMAPQETGPPGLPASSARAGWSPFTMDADRYGDERGAGSTNRGPARIEARELDVREARREPQPIPAKDATGSLRCPNAAAGCGSEGAGKHVP